MAKITKTGKGTIEEFMGKPVTPPIAYEFSYDVYEKLEDVKGTEDWPSENEILKIVNTTSERGAKASEYQKKTKDLREAYEKTDEYATKSLIASIVAAGKTAAEAEGLAQSILGTRFKQ